MPEPSLNSPVGTPFIELLSVDSTNNYALTQLRAGLAQHGTAFFAHEQSAGKGQRGKSWSAEPNSSILLSVVIDPWPISLINQFQVSACTAVAAAEFLKQYAGDEIRIKWPNDLYWRDRKAGGILIENIIGTGALGQTNSNLLPERQNREWQWAVTGIGINVNQASFPPELKNPVSLRQITGKTYEAVELGRELCTFIGNRYKELITAGFSSIYREYNSLLYMKDQTTRLRKSNRVFEALIMGVTRTGMLEVEHGIHECYGFGEIEWILPNDNPVK